MLSNGGEGAKPRQSLKSKLLRQRNENGHFRHICAPICSKFMKADVPELERCVNGLSR